MTWVNFLCKQLILLLKYQQNKRNKVFVQKLLAYDFVHLNNFREVKK